MEKIPIAQLSAQHDWHDEAYILANREGLLALQKAIVKALKNGQGKEEAFVCDGEGFKICIIVKNEDLIDWREIAVPYVSDIASEKNVKALRPWDLW
jgi:hypothetical protein